MSGKRLRNAGALAVNLQRSQCEKDETIGANQKEKALNPTHINLRQENDKGAM